MAAFKAYENFKISKVLNSKKIENLNSSFYFKNNSILSKKLIISKKLVNLFSLNYNYLKLVLIIFKKYYISLKKYFIFKKKLKIMLFFNFLILKSKSIIFFKKNNNYRKRYYFQKFKKRYNFILTVCKKYFKFYTTPKIYLFKPNFILLYKKIIKNGFLIKNNNFMHYKKSFKIIFKNFIFKKIGYFFKTKLKNTGIFIIKKRLKMVTDSFSCKLFEFLINIYTFFIYLSKNFKNIDFPNIFKFFSQKYLNFLLILDYLLGFRKFKLSYRTSYLFYTILNLFRVSFPTSLEFFKKHITNKVKLSEFLSIVTSFKFSLLLDFFFITLLTFSPVYKILKNVEVKILNLYNFLIKKKLIFFFNFKCIKIYSPTDNFFSLIDNYLKFFKPTIEYSSKLLKIFCSKLSPVKYSSILSSLPLLDSLYYNFNKIKKIYKFLIKLGKLVSISFNIVSKKLNFASFKFILNFIFKCVSISNNYIFYFLNLAIKKPVMVFLLKSSKYLTIFKKISKKKKIKFFKNSIKIKKIKLKNYAISNILKIKKKSNFLKTMLMVYNYSKIIILRLYNMLTLYEFLKKPRTLIDREAEPNPNLQDSNYIQFFKEYGSI